MGTATMTFERTRRRTVGERIGITQLDPLLTLAVLGLIGTSILTLAFTTKTLVAGDPYFYVSRQAIYAVVGIALMLALSRLDYSRFRELRVGLYTLMVLAIGLVFVAGTAIRGTKGWIELPFFNFQPSELGKVLLVLALAAFAIERSKQLPDWQRTVRLLCLGAFPAVLVLLQPDLGTALVYGAITAAVLFIAEVRWTHFAAIGGVALATIAAILVVAPALGVTVLTDEQESRLTGFVNPSDDPAESSYQVNQALIAVGSGGKTGRGDDATQTRHGFLPEAETDFIFAVIAERWGFVGAAFLLSLYALLIWRGLRILTLAKNRYGAIVAAGVVAMLMFHIFENVGMNIGILPITGIPLPFVSFGGSSVVTMFIAIGLLQSIYVQSRLTSEARAPDPVTR